VGGGRGGCRRFVIILCLDDRYDDDDQQEDNTQCHDGGPLGILPPHLLANAVGTLAERLRRDGQVIRLVLKRVEVFSTLSNFGDIISHDTDSVVDLTLDCCRLGVAACLGSSARRGATAGQVRVIGFGHIFDLGC